MKRKRNELRSIFHIKNVYANVDGDWCGHIIVFDAAVDAAPVMFVKKKFDLSGIQYVDSDERRGRVENKLNFWLIIRI